jgi:hypothetical protein
MSAWLDGPVAGPLVDGDLCEAGWAGERCEDPAVVIAHNLHGSEVLLCERHAARHGLVPLAVASC